MRAHGAHRLAEERARRPQRLGPRGGSDADDLAVAAFARRIEAATAPVDAALAKAKAAVARLRDEQGLLRDYVDEKDLPIPVILEADGIAAKCRKNRTQPTADERAVVDRATALRDEIVQVQAFDELGAERYGAKRPALLQTEEWLADANKDAAVAA